MTTRAKAGAASVRQERRFHRKSIREPQGQAQAEQHPFGGELGSAWASAYEKTIAGDPVVLNPADLTGTWGERFSASEMYSVVIPKRTLSRRLRAKEPLSVEETDRALRLARISAEAERVFGDPERSARWLREPSPALNQQRPLDVLRTEAGAKAVETLLGQIDHGMFI